MRKVMCCLISVTAMVILTGFSIGVVQAGTCELPFFHASAFDTSNDNPYLSMDNIRSTYVYKAETDEGLVRDYIYFKPASENITIYGVECTVVYDVEWLWVEELSKWVKLEETDDWHAWDEDGNFWYFGEETTEYLYNDEWESTGTSNEGSWKAGVDGALPGIILLADPTPGDCVLQEYYEGEAEDRGKVLRLNGNVCDQCEKDCLVTKEWTKLEPGNVEHKYYAPVLGLVYIEELKEKTVIFELVNYFLGPPPDLSSAP